MSEYSTWVSKAGEIRSLIRNGNIEDCLTWDVIRQSINTDEEPHSEFLDYFEQSVMLVSELKTIVEVGPGVGILCRNIFERNFSGDYWSYDLPEMQEIQRHLLSGRNVRYAGMLDELPKTGCLFISSYALEEIPDNGLLMEYAQSFDHHMVQLNGPKDQFQTLIDSQPDWKVTPVGQAAYKGLRYVR